MTDWTDYLAQHEDVRLPDLRVVVIGAGLSGVCMGAKLVRAGVSDFTILEKAASTGGTWRENRYPGAACDLNAHLYSFTFHKNPYFSQTSAPAAEINAYLDDVVSTYGFADRIEFGREVVGCVWSGNEWHIDTADGEKRSADVVIACCGFLHVPNIPDIEGMSEYEGHLFHSARCDTSVDIAGTRFANIGNGSSSVQIVPAVVDEVAQLTVFQRTPQWILPTPNEMFSPEQQQAFAADSSLMDALYAEKQAEVHYLFGHGVLNEPAIVAQVQEMCNQYLDTITDPELRAKLQPTYPVMCKRLIFASGRPYYEAFAKPNAELVTDRIVSFTKKGIRTADGVEREFDVICLSTGFRAHEWCRPIGLVGDGISLDEAWSDGAVSYETTTLAGFPNFFMLGGPYSPTGNTSFMAAAELQSTHILRLLAMRSEHGAAAIAPRPERQQAFVDDMRRQSEGTVWQSGCASWYHDDQGRIDIWTRSPEDFVAMFAAGPNSDDFVFMGAQDSRVGTGAGAVSE